MVFNEAELARMTPGERAELARTLAALDDADPPAADPPAADPAAAAVQRRRRLVVAAALAGVAVLAVWIAVLAMTLPRFYRAGGWRVTWVGFDAGLLVTFAATAWAAWRRRQVLIACLIVLSTLLCCDAWFDTTLDWRTSGFALSLIMALAVELPVAAAALTGARRLMRLTISRLEHLEGVEGPVPPFWKVPLFGDSGVGYRHLLRGSQSDRRPAGGARAP